MYSLNEHNMQPFDFYTEHVVFLYSLERSEDNCPLTMSVRAGPLTLPVLIDTGAFTSALSIDSFKQIELQSPSSIRNKTSKPDFKVCVASNDPVDVLFCCEIEFDLPVGSFIENFLVLPEMKDILLGISFCTKNNLVIDFQNRLLKLPDFTLQLNRLKKSDEATERLNNRKQIDLFLNNCEQLNPFEQKFVCASAQLPVCLQSTTGIVEPLNSVEQEHEICLTSSLDTFNSDNEVYLGIINASPNLVLLPKYLKIAKFSILTTEQANFLLPVEPAILAQQKFHKHISQLLKDNNYRQHRVKAQQSKTFWFPTPETCERPDELNGIEKTIFLQLQEFREKEKLNPFSSKEDRVEFLKQFLWESTLLTIEEKTQLEVLVEYHDIFARHRLDVGRNDVFKVKLTPEHERPVYTQSPPTPIHIRDELQIELALLQYYAS